MDKWTRGLIIQAIRQGFKGCDTYKLAASRYLSPVKGVKGGKRWVCAHCKEIVTSYNIDHISPVVEIGKSTNDYSIQDYYERVHLTPLENLQLLCKECHNKKSKGEEKQRRELKPKQAPKPRKKKRINKNL